MVPLHRTQAGFEELSRSVSTLEIADGFGHRQPTELWPDDGPAPLSRRYGQPS